MVREVLLPGDIILLSIFLWPECSPMGLTARESGKYRLTGASFATNREFMYNLLIFKQIKAFYFIIIFLRHGLMSCSPGWP